MFAYDDDNFIKRYDEIRHIQKIGNSLYLLLSERARRLFPIKPNEAIIVTSTPDCIIIRKKEIKNA